MTVRSRVAMTAATFSLLAWMAVAVVHAQAPAAPPAPAQPPAAASQPVEAHEKPKPPEPSTYSYEPNGRRDPFVSLIGRGRDVSAPAKRPEGLAGLLVDEVNVKGIVKSGNTFVAMVQAPDNKTYILHQSERLFDGVVSAIGPDAVLFLQEVNDPLSPAKRREVRKLLRPMEDARQ